tara:strand:+ start:140 stop:427 length:288 start_codon:yes stop_codon:yes gene_type:complete
MNGNFSIIQDDKTHRSWLRHEENGEVKLTECPEKDWPYLRLLASLIRNSDDPSVVMEYVSQQIKKGEDKAKSTNWDVEPGFFIPPEELDGLEDED